MVSTLILLTAWTVCFQDADATAVEEVTAEAVIDHYIEARGGLEQLKKVKFCSQKGDYWLNGHRYGVFEIHRGDNCQRSSFHFVGGTRLERGTDGDIVWEIRNGRSQILEANRRADFLRNNRELQPALKWKENLEKIRNVQSLELQGKKLHRLDFDEPGGLISQRYFEADTGLLKREVRVSADDPSNPQLILEWNDYRPVESGTVEAHRVLYRFSSRQAFEYVIRKFTFNDIDEFAFELPKKIVDLQRQTSDGKIP